MSAIVLDQPHQIAFYTFLARRGALKLERLGLRHSGHRSVLQIIKRDYLLPPSYRTRDQVILWMDTVVTAVFEHEIIFPMLSKDLFALTRKAFLEEPLP